jgi:HEAT repeat protein
MLLASDSFERTSAARSLGEIKSPLALPFLLEGLYDQEPIVRNQAVVSIGELKIPSAIGALLDMARRNPDAPSALVSRALSSCTFEGLDLFDTAFQQQLLSEDFSREITKLQPATSVEDLPETSDDEALAQAIGKLNSKDAEVRAEAVKSLAQYPVQTSVSGLALLARLDPEPSIRAMAISSLSSINHESVFSAVLIGMADDSREVRAAAARSLSRLSFDRAEAYVRVLENADNQMLREVASACIKAGIVAQNIDRLESNDPRQAYEAFSLISLLAKASMIEPILQAISNHSNIDVRLAAIHLLGNTGRAEIVGDLRKIAVEDRTPEEVKTALVEAIYRLEQSKPHSKDAKESSWLDTQTELMDSEKSERNSDFDFRPAFESELKQETQIHLDEFEM